MRYALAIVISTVLPFPIAGCGNSTGNDQGVAVSSSDFGEKWPLTVSEGRVECIDGFIAVFHHNGKTWALNGAAQSRGFPEIDPIWKANPNIPGAKLNIGPLIDLALQQCE